MLKFYWINDWWGSFTDLHIVDVVFFAVPHYHRWDSDYGKTHFGFEVRVMNLGFGVQYTKMEKSKNAQRSFGGGGPLLKKHMGGDLSPDAAGS